MQLDSLLTAPGFWAEIEDLSGLPSGYGRTGRLQPVLDEATADRLADRIDGARRNWPADMGMVLTRDPDADIVPHSPSGIWLSTQYSTCRSSMSVESTTPLRMSVWAGPTS